MQDWKINITFAAFFNAKLEHNMKKLVIFIAAALLLSSCVKDSEEYKKLKAENDSLTAAKANKDKEINSYFKTLNDISDNFDKISSSEQLVTTEASHEKISVDAAQRIKDNIQLMSDALQKSKEKIAILEQQVKKGGRGYAEMQKTIDRLTESMNEKALTIDSLKAELANKDRRIFELDKQVGVLSKDNKDKSDLIKKQSDEMSSVYYVFGTRRELKAQNIITKTGFFSSTKVLQADFNKEFFVKDDLRTLKSIPVYNKKAKILTSHPLTSYTITTENGNKVIQIKDPVQFWSVSRYLVVEID